MKETYISQNNYIFILLLMKYINLSVVIYICGFFGTFSPCLFSDFLMIALLIYSIVLQHHQKNTLTHRVLCTSQKN